MLTTVENLIIERLKETAAARNLKAAVDTYGGQLDDSLLRQLVQQGPALYVVFTGMQPARKRNTGTEYDISFSVIASSSALKSEQARKGGYGGRVIGAYDLVDFAGATLMDFCEDPLVQPLMPGAVRNLFNAKVDKNLLAVYGVTFTGRVLWTPDAFADLDDFEAIHHETTPDIAAGDAITTTIPQTNET